MTRDLTNSNLQPYPIQHDSEQQQDEPSLFDGTVYHISPSLPPTLVAQLDALLLANGARRAGEPPIQKVGSQGQQVPSTSQNSQIQAEQQQPPTQDPTLTIVISDSLRFPGWEDIARRRAREVGSGVPDEVTGEEKYSVHVVLPAWVERGVVLGKMQHPAHYSPDPSLLFSSLTCTASTTSLSPSDITTLQAGVTSLGGQWRSSLTREVTHLFALSREGREYETAMHFQRETGVKVLLPHWFDDVVRLGVRVEEGPYEWPDPELLRDAGEKGRETEKEKGISTSQGPTKEKEKPTDVDAERARLKRSVFVTAARFTPALTACPPPSQTDLDNTHKNGVQPVSSSPGGDGAPASSAVGGVPGAADADTSIAHLAPPHTSSFSLPAVVTISAPKVWEGRRILLSRTLQLWGRRRDSVQAGIERAGGIVVRFEGDEEEQEEVPISPEDAQEHKSNGSTVGKDGERGFGYDERLSRQERHRRRREAERVKDCDVLVTRWREGRGYVEAVRTQKLVGTLAWLFHVQSCGVLSHPLNQLLHYPVPKRRIEGFSAHVITVTNYTGEAREYIKKLVTAMGATFTPSMSGSNTVLVAAYISGTKATKATAWSIPIVNHTWLEDCFIAWRNLTPANPKYIIFRTGDDWSRRLGERGVAVGVRNGISGGWGAVARVGVGEGETQDETQEGQGEERELGRIEQEAEELAEEGDELGDSETDEAEARAEAVAASAPAVGAAVIDAGTGDHSTEVHPPNGTEASMKEVMDDLVDADDAMEIDVDDPGQVHDEDADGVKVSTKKAKPVSSEQEREKEKGKSSPVKPTFSPRKSKHPAPTKSKSQFKGNPRDSGSDENEEEEGYRKETVIEVPSSPSSEESDDHDERRQEKTKSSGKTPRSASNVKEKSKSKSTKPASDTESEADNENKEEDVVAEEAEEERPQSPVLKKSKPKSTPKSAAKARTNTDTKKRAEDKSKVKNRKTRVPGSSDEEDEDEVVEDDDTGGNGDAMDVDTDAEHSPKSKAKSTTKTKSKSKSKSTNKESPTSKLTPQTSSKVAENGKASSSSKSKSKKTVQVSSGTEDEDEDDNKSAQSTDVELDVEEASKPAPAKKKPLTRRVTVEITVPSPAKGSTAAAAAKATGGTGTPSRVSGTTTTTTPSASPKPNTTPVESTAGGGLLTRMIKVDARTRVKRRKPGDEGKKRKRSDVYVETSESEDEVVEPEQVVTVAKGKSKGKGKEVKARDSVRGKGKQVEEAKVVSPKGKVKAKSQHTKGRKGKKAVSDDDDAEAKVVESEDEVDTEEEENEEIVVSSRKIESTSKTSSSKSKVKPTPKAVAKIKAKDKKAAKVSASSTSEEEKEEEEAEEEEEEEEDLPPPKKRPDATSKSKKHAPPPSPSPPPERDHAQLFSPSKRKKPLRVYSSPDDDDDEEEEEDSDDGLPLNPFTLSKAEQRAKDAKQRKEKERKAAEEEAERQRKKKANSLSAKVKGKVEKAYGKGRTAKKVAAAASETESEEEDEEDDKDEDDAPPRKGTKAKAKSKAVDHSPRTLKHGKGRGKDNEDAHEGEQVSVSFGVKRKGKKTAAPSSDEEEEEEEERPARKASKAKPDTTKATSKPKPSAKAKSAKSTLPTESENESEEEDEVSLLVSPGRAARALTRTESLRAVAGQQATSSSAVPTPIKVNGVAETSISAADKGRKGGKATNATAATSSKAKAKQSNDAPMDVDDSVSVSISTAGPSAVSVPPRRSAAAKASQRLHETIMPDLVHYESQVKKARRASSHAASSTAFALADEGENVRVPGPSEKRKKTAGDGDEDQGTVDQADGKAVKKRRVGEKAKAQDNDMDVDQSLPGQGIVIMTTQVTLSDDVVKTLVKLGVKITVRASECTHLLAPHVVRTEKFLCAVASRAPWVLQDRWAIESANARKILPEKGFILKDKSGENKYGVNLVQALERAKANIKDGGLLKGHIFYLTPRVPVDAKLLKNVVVASGGQVSTQTPTLRVISTAPSLRHVISCSDDIAIWRPLTSSKAVRIYTQELLLNGVLKQEMEWEKDDYFVPGSF